MSAPTSRRRQPLQHLTPRKIYVQLAWGAAGALLILSALPIPGSLGATHAIPIAACFAAVLAVSRHRDDANADLMEALADNRLSLECTQHLLRQVAADQATGDAQILAHLEGLVAALAKNHAETLRARNAAEHARGAAEHAQGAASDVKAILQGAIVRNGELLLEMNGIRDNLATIVGQIEATAGMAAKVDAANEAMAGITARQMEIRSEVVETAKQTEAQLAELARGQETCAGRIGELARTTAAALAARDDAIHADITGVRDDMAKLAGDQAAREQQLRGLDARISSLSDALVAQGVGIIESVGTSLDQAHEAVVERVTEVARRLDAIEAQAQQIEQFRQQLETLEGCVEELKAAVVERLDEQIEAGPRPIPINGHNGHARGSRPAGR